MPSSIRAILETVTGRAGRAEPTEIDRPERQPVGDESPLAEIARIGRAMYGERWISSIAKDTGEHVRQVQRWRAGTSQPSPRALKAVRQAARRHIDRIQRALGGPDE